MTVESCDLKFTCPDSSGSNCLQVFKKLVPRTDCEKMIHAFISNGSDCCNALFAGLSPSSEFLHIGKYNHYPSVYVTSLAPRTHTQICLKNPSIGSWSSQWFGSLVQVNIIQWRRNFQLVYSSCIPPSMVFNLSGAGSRWQQPKRRSPDLPLSSQLLQLVREI